ncbi:GH20761 [Drosophila grimshawi]|uniref:GH20761 n=1 Tax=Drosophila grimshawi TaxID=7222 RepID=B4J6C7_DROGR|nr:GH20761 [Drosophila grimshawi]
MFKALLVLLFVNLALAAPAIFVPRISVEDENQFGWKLEPHDDRYELDVLLNEATRVETVQEISLDELQVNGRLYQFYPDNNGKLHVTYKADRNGYVAKYQYGTLDSGSITPQSLPASILKAAAG